MHFFNSTLLLGSILLGSILGEGSNWNIILVLIVICSIVSVTIFIERLLQLHRAEINTNQLIIAMRKAIKQGNIVEAVQICEKTVGTIATIIRSGLVKHHKSKEQIESAMEMTGLVEIARLEKNAKILSIIAYITPLIGLLGTVLGFIQAFSEMRLSGMVDISATRIGEAMEYSLITTAAVAACPGRVGVGRQPLPAVGGGHVRMGRELRFRRPFRLRFVPAQPRGGHN